MATRSNIQSEILQLKQSLQLAKETISRFKEEIGKVEGGSVAAAVEATVGTATVAQ